MDQGVVDHVVLYLSVAVMPQTKIARIRRVPGPVGTSSGPGNFVAAKCDNFSAAAKYCRSDLSRQIRRTEGCRMRYERAVFIFGRAYKRISEERLNKPLC